MTLSEARAHVGDGVATDDDIRARIYRHLMAHPGLTAYELGRALGLRTMYGSGGNRVRRHLVAMERDGEAEGVEGIRGEGDARPAIRWRTITRELTGEASGEH